jgi:hypothetical protein
MMMVVVWRTDRKGWMREAEEIWTREEVEARKVNP